MYGALNLTPATFSRIIALHEALDIPKTSVSEVALGTTMFNIGGVGVYHVNVSFKSGHGNRDYMIDQKDGSLVQR